MDYQCLGSSALGYNMYVVAESDQRNRSFIVGLVKISIAYVITLNIVFSMTNDLSLLAGRLEMHKITFSIGTYSAVSTREHVSTVREYS